MNLHLTFHQHGGGELVDNEWIFIVWVNSSFSIRADRVCLRSVVEGRCCITWTLGALQRCGTGRGEGRSDSDVSVLLYVNLLVTKLEPQCTLEKQSHSTGTTRTQTTEHHSASRQVFFFFFFAVRAITCHKMMASTKSTGEPISLFVSCKRIKQQININACKFKYMCVFFFLSYLALSDFFSLLGICNRWSCYETCMSLVMISVVCFFFFSHLTINTLFV